MTDKTKRRNLLRQAAKAALVGAMGIKAVSATEETWEPLRVSLPDKIAANEPFALQISVPKVTCGEGETRWIEVWLGREYLGRFEFANPTQNASLNLTLTLPHSTTLRVRDFYGRTVVKRLRVR
jgi:desulfoferrodoxin (superoxide reductase-like protein)